MANVLVTCAGSGVGQSAIDALYQLRRDKVIGCDMNAKVYASHYCDKFYIVPNLYSDGYLDRILDICEKERIDIVIPGHDHELLIFSTSIDKFDSRGVEVIISRPDLIKISRDKYQWYKYFIAHGCPMVPTCMVKEFKQSPDPSLFPAIVKPCGGSASQGITIINKMEQLESLNDLDIIQPYLFPQRDDPNYNAICTAVSNRRFIQMSEISIQLIFTRESEFKGIFISKNTLKNGVPVTVEPILPEDFDYLDDIMKFVPVLLENKVKGPVNIQGRITDKGLVCFEMNMRFTGITGNRSQFGFNEVAFLVNNFLGRPARLGSYTPNKLGVRQVACTTIRNGKPKKEKIISVFGGGAFGESFISSLINEDKIKKINLICRASSYEAYEEKYGTGKVEVISVDDSYVESALSQSDAAVNFISSLANKPDKDIYSSIIYQHKLIARIIKGKVPLVINISSQSVYDRHAESNRKETDNLDLHNLYSFQKYLAEEFFDAVNTHGPSVRVVSLRLSRIIDTGAAKGFFSESIADLLKGKAVNVPFPENKINLIDIRDAVSAVKFLLARDNERDLPSRINVGGTNVSLREYFQVVADSIGKTRDELLLIYGESDRVAENATIDTGLLNKMGWKPVYTIDRIVSDLLLRIKSTGE